MFDLFVFLFKKEEIKFLFVGVLNTLFGYLIYAIAIFLGFSYFWAATIATILGVVFNFKSIASLVFNHGGEKCFVKFFCVYLVLYLLNLLGLTLLHYLDSNMYMAGLVMTVFLAFLSFVVNKRWVFVKGI